MNQFQDDCILPIDLFCDWNQDESNEASEKESNMVIADEDVHDYPFDKVPASPAGSSQILSQLTFLACDTKAQTANSEKLQCRMMRAVQTIERQKKENQELRMENAQLFEQLAVTRIRRYGENDQTIEKEHMERDQFKNVSTNLDRSRVDVRCQNYTRIDELSSIDAFSLDVDQISSSTSTSNESTTMFKRANNEEKTSYIYSLLRQHSETFPIVGNILNVTTLMEFRLSEMETILCNIETRWKRSRTKIDGLDVGVGGGNLMPLDKDTKGCELRTHTIKEMKVDCVQVEGTNSTATLHDSKVPSPSVLSQISWTLMEAGSTMKEAVAVLRSVVENLEILCDSSTENRAVDANAVKIEGSDLSRECPPDLNVNLASKKIASGKQDGGLDLFEELEVENTRLKSEYEHQVIRQIQQDTLFLQKHDHNEKLVIACTAALKVASNLEEIIHGFESCSFDHDDENTESMQIQINELREQQQILTEQLCTLQFEHVECHEKLKRIQAENFDLKDELKKNEASFLLFKSNVNLDFEKVSIAFEHQVSEIDVQLCSQIETIQDKIKQDEVLLVSTVKQLQEQGRHYHDLHFKSQNDAFALVKMTEDLVQIQNSYAAAAKQNEFQALSLEMAIADAKAGEEKLNILQSKLEICERKASQAVKDSKELQLRNENVLAIVLLCISFLAHGIAQFSILD